MKTERVKRRRLQVAKAFDDFVNDDVLPGTGLEERDYWTGFDAILARLMPENRALLARRDRLQSQIDEWHRIHALEPFDATAYKAFLAGIGYLEPEGPDFAIATDPLDPEMSVVAGPQLVVPLTNARYALNAANARWGSLYDALYGTDMLGAPPEGGYDSVRGAKVIAFAREFLDMAVPLAAGSYKDALEFRVAGRQLMVGLPGDKASTLKNPAQFVGYRGSKDAPSTILLVDHGLHIEIHVDRDHPVGKGDKAGVSDVILEAATTVIMDLEDSVATVDAADKIAAYRNWLGLMTGRLTAQFEKGGRTQTRALNKDRQYFAGDGSPIELPGRSLALIRNVGHLQSTDTILWEDGKPVPEGIVDAMITATIALHGLKRTGADGLRPSSATGSIYIVKPKMHGPEEVAFADKLFDLVEDAIGLKRHAIKLGLMDEERRTSVNLKACIRAAGHRIAFINTGFLDRTGDEVHTSMEAGAMLPKNAMREARWMKAYEKRNVCIGLRCGFKGRAQIGKGMWTKPDKMADLYREKVAHVRSGANTAWVPSPTAAVIHALHYHGTDVSAVQAETVNTPCPPVEELLEIPLMRGSHPTEWDVQRELDNNCQSILGYVVRWIDEGVGCSKVPDINDVGLMEDRATLRISSQHIANWLRHGLFSREHVAATLQDMARIVDAQNAGQAGYRPMAEDCDGNLAFQAAKALILEGYKQPNGYTEPILHRYRALAKRRDEKAMSIATG